MLWATLDTRTEASFLVNWIGRCISFCVESNDFASNLHTQNKNARNPSHDQLCCNSGESWRLACHSLKSYPRQWWYDSPSAHSTDSAQVLHLNRRSAPHMSTHACGLQEYSSARSTKGTRLCLMFTSYHFMHSVSSLAVLG